MSWKDFQVSLGDESLPAPGPGLLRLGGLLPSAPAPALAPAGPALTGEDLQGEWVLLLDGVGKVEAGVAAVVRLHVLHHHVREIQVPIMALGHPLILGDGLHGYKEAEVQWEVSSNENCKDNHEVSGEWAPTEG